MLLPLHSSAAASTQAPAELPVQPDAPVDPSSPAPPVVEEQIFTPRNPPSPEEEMRTPMPWQWPEDLEAEKERMMSYLEIKLLGHSTGMITAMLLAALQEKGGDDAMPAQAGIKRDGTCCSLQSALDEAFT